MLCYKPHLVGVWFGLWPWSLGLVWWPGGKWPGWPGWPDGAAEGEQEVEGS